MTYHLVSRDADGISPADDPALPSGPSLLHFIMRSRALADPHRILGEFRAIVDRWGPVCSTRTGLAERSYFVSDHAVVDTIFGDHECFRKYPHHTADLGKLQALIGKGMLATHTDDEWSAHRRSVARTFSKSATRDRFGRMVLHHCDILLDRLAADGGTSCNISEQAMLLSGRVMSDILAPNHPFEDTAILDIKKLLDASILDFHRWDYRRRARPYKAALQSHIAKLIEAAARPEAPVGLVRTMMDQEPDWKNRPAARERLISQSLNLLVAGFETTATTLNWVVYLIAAHPDIQEALHAAIDDDRCGHGVAFEAFDEHSLLHRVTLEAMRLYSVLWFNIRYVIKETRIQGHRFQNGARVMLLPFIANRSDAVYENPDDFDPDRYLRGEPHPLFPFGNGPRVCIGRPLAELELGIFVIGLLRRFQLRPLSEPKAIGGVLIQPDADVLIGFRGR